MAVVALLFMGGCSFLGDQRPILSAPRHQASVMPAPQLEEPEMKCAFLGKGLASWYGNEMAGNHTASGEMFKPNGVTAAHRTLPFGTIIYVTLDDLSRGGNPKGVYARVNDRGPFKRGRIVDLSWGAAKKLGMMDTQRVHVYKCS